MQLRFPSTKPQEFASLALTLVKLRQHPHKYWLDSLISETGKTLEKFNPQGLANLSWALALLEHCPSETWSRKFLQRCLDLFPVFKAQDFVQVRLQSLDITCEPNDRRAWVVGTEITDMTTVVYSINT